jgi:hypothetical protein
MKSNRNQFMKGYKIHYVNELGTHPPMCGNVAANNVTTDPKKVTCSVCWKSVTNS